jgi:2-dehydropantoate 2-reductase
MNPAPVTRVAIVGAGAVGGLLGGVLALPRSPHLHVVFVLRRLSRVAELQRDGLHLTSCVNARPGSLNGGELDVRMGPTDLSQCHVVFVACKLVDLPELLVSLAKCQLAPGAVLISCHNGLQGASLIRQSFPGHAVLSAMVGFQASFMDVHHLHMGTDSPLLLERGAPGAGDHVSRVVTALQAYGMTVQTHEDLRPFQCTKLLINLNNALNALCGLPILVNVQDERMRFIWADMIDEARRVFQAQGMATRRIGLLIPCVLSTVLRLPTWLFVRVARSVRRFGVESNVHVRLLLPC